MTDDLITKKCIPCETWTPSLKGDKLKEFMNKLTLPWELVDEMKIKHMFEFGDFKEAIAFVNKVAVLAEEEQHHPNISIVYNKVTITLYTHKIKGLSENDFILARKIEELQP